MPLVKHNSYTIDDIYALPAGERAELIEGELFNMAPPSRKHQEFITFFTKEIGNYIDNNHGSCKIYPAPFAVFLKTEESDEGYDNYVEPDISVICDPSKLTDKGCVGAPDWVIEIVSPSSRKMDYYLKLSLYQMNGVKEYWIVDPERKIIIVYNFKLLTPAALYRFTDTVKANIYENLEIDFRKLSL